MREEVASSFRLANPDEISQAPQCDYLRSEYAELRSRSNGNRSVAWSPNGSYFAWSCGRGYVYLYKWDSNQNRILRSSADSKATLSKQRIFDCGESVWSLAFSTLPELDSSKQEVSSTHLRPRHINFKKYLTLAIGVNSGRIQLWNCHNGNLLCLLDDHTKLVRCLNFAPDGSQILVSGSNDGTLKLWDLDDDGNMTHTLHTPLKNIVYCCKFSPGARYLAACGEKRLVMIWKMKKPYEIFHRLAGHQNDVVSCDFSPDGVLLATASYDTRVIIWDIHEGRALRELGHLFPSPRPIFAGGCNSYYVRSVTFSRLGTYLGTVADDGYVRMWNLLSTSEDPESIAVVTNGLCCGFSPTGQVLAVGTRSGCVYFYTSQQRVPSLQHKCRQVIRSKLPNKNNTDFLKIPHRLKEYLCYEEW